jgi:hypothetical protein
MLFYSSSVPLNLSLKSYKHERYNSDLIRNDIAIIKLTNEVTESRNVKFICINRDPKLVTNEPLVVIGMIIFY